MPWKPYHPAFTSLEGGGELGSAVIALQLSRVRSLDLKTYYAQPTLIANKTYICLFDCTDN